MKRSVALTTAVLTIVVLAIAGCAQPAPPPSPTQAPPVPTKAAAAQPTAAPAQPTAAAAQPTAAPAKIAWPERGKVITYLVPWGAGGPYDTAARIMAPGLEKDLGVTVQVVNREGATGQIGMTELATGKTDGYTFAITGNPATIMTYLDESKKAVYGRKDFQPVAMYATSDNVLAVGVDSKYKTLKDILDAAKANPEKVTIGDTGVGGSLHLATLGLSQATGTKFAEVHFSSAPTAMTSVLGGSLDASMQSDSGVLPQVKGGQAKIIAVFGSQRNKFYPDVPTATEQGFKVVSETTQGITVKAGTPMEIVLRLSLAFKNTLADPEVLKKMENFIVRYADTPGYEADWDRQEALGKQLLPLIRK